MIKVLQVITELGDGGVEMMLTNLYSEIDTNLVQFIFCVQSDKRNIEIEKLGGKIVQILPMSESGIILYMKAIYLVCKKYDVDCVHCHNLLQNIFILLSAKLAGVKNRISHSHLTTAHRKIIIYFMPLFRFLINMLSTERLACGVEAGKFLYGNKNFTIINNAINTEKFIRFNNHILVDQIKNKYGENILLHVGRLSKQKNHNYLIKLAKKLKEKNLNFTIICCGDGPLKDDISNMILQNGLEKEVKLLGSISNIVPYYYASKIMLLPSLYEGLPVVSIEMQATGLQGIFSDSIDQTCDLGLGLITFLGIENNDLDRWVNKILDLLNSKLSMDRKQIIIALNKNGYNLKDNAKLLLNMYIGRKVDEN